MAKFSTPKSRSFIIALVIIVVLAILAGACWSANYVLTRRTITKAEALLQKGFASLTADTLEKDRHRLARTEQGCKILVATYFNTRHAERLAWASEACLENGREIPEAYLGLAGSRELMGRDGEALNILNQASTKFKDSADPVYRIALILKRLKNDAGATKAYLEANRRAPKNPQLTLEAMEYFLALKDWTNARKMAEQIKTVQTDNPEVKLIIARALIRGGDEASAEPIIKEAKDLIAKRPEIKEAIEKAYKDVL